METLHRQDLKSSSSNLPVPSHMQPYKFLMTPKPNKLRFRETESAELRGRSKKAGLEEMV